MFYSLVTLAQKAASAIGIPVVLLALDAVGYQAGAAEQGPGAVRAIRFVMGPLPAILLCAGIVFALLYPLGRKRFVEITRELDERRSKGA